MFKFILVFLLILLVLRMLGRFVIITNFSTSAGKRQKENFKEVYEEHKKKEGEITIQKTGNKNQDDGGDYVDYEEVKG